MSALGQKADISACSGGVRFTPESGHPLKALEKALGAPLFTRLVDDGSRMTTVAVRTTQSPCSGSAKSRAINKAEIAATVTRMQKRNCDRYIRHCVRNHF